MANPFSPDNPLTNPQDVPEAVVTIGTVEVDDLDAEFEDSGDDITLFADWQVLNRFEKDKHIYMMPVASPNGFNGGSAAFVQLAAPTLLWIADWTVARFKKQPIAPNPESVNPNWILLDEHYEPASLAYGPDGTTPIWRLSGTFTYGHKSPSNATVENISYARPPWMDDVFDRTMPASLLQQGLIDSNQVLD